ncbi:MAG: hypothetical protein ACJ74O_05400 [Frankiaceae bacterium]
MTEPSGALHGDALGLLRIPESFTQDQLLRTDEFVRAAASLGMRIDAGVLERLHRGRLLIPLFLLTDDADPTSRLENAEPPGMNPRGWAFEAARQGRLRDPHQGSVIDDYPYHPPVNAAPRWWDGYLYSSWQLVELPHALDDERLLSLLGEDAVKREQRRYVGTLAAAALATRHLPDITGRVTFPGGVDHEALWRSRYELGDEQRLAIVGVDPTHLQEQAERLLRWARDDPMIKWWPVIRHAGHRGWSKIAGKPALAIKHRVEAELLLRGHEELSTAGLLPPLPEPTAMAAHPLDDRVSPQRGGRSLDAELARLGVSPHPRVVLLLEGKTERMHATALAGAMGINRPNLLRVVDLGGSKVRPDLIARYVATPRLAGASNVGDQELDALPTAVIIAMDPENLWETAEQRTARLRALQAAVRTAVSEQGGRIGQQELDFLVEVRTWEHTYEFANFTVEELADAIMTGGKGVELDRAAVIKELATQRATKHDVGVALGRLRTGMDKIRLAELLEPVLLRKLDTPSDGEEQVPPIINLVSAAHDKISALLGGSYVLAGEDAARE